MKQVDEELELTRLLAGEPTLAPLVETLKGRAPDAAELASLASRLALRGIDVAPPPAAPAVAKAWKKWAMGGGGAALAVLTWLALRAPVSRAPTPHHGGPTRAAAASAERAAPAPDRTPAPAAPPGERQQEARRAAPPGVDAAATQPESAESPSVPTTPERELASARQLGEASEAATPAPKGREAKANVPKAPATRLPAGAVVRPTTSTDSVAKPDSAAAPTEIELLRDARLALGKSPASALALAEQHARVYPGGKLTQERELIAISALVALGRRTAALDRAARFEQTFPTSPYRKQVGDLLR